MLLVTLNDLRCHLLNYGISCDGKKIPDNSETYLLMYDFPLSFTGRGFLREYHIHPEHADKASPEQYFFFFFSMECVISSYIFEVKLASQECKVGNTRTHDVEVAFRTCATTLRDGHNCRRASHSRLATHNIDKGQSRRQCQRGQAKQKQKVQNTTQHNTIQQNSNTAKQQPRKSNPSTINSQYRLLAGNSLQFLVSCARR